MKSTYPCIYPYCRLWPFFLPKDSLFFVLLACAVNMKPIYLKNELQFKLIDEFWINTHSHTLHTVWLWGMKKHWRSCCWPLASAAPARLLYLLNVLWRRRVDSHPVFWFMWARENRHTSYMQMTSQHSHLACLFVCLFICLCAAAQIPCLRLIVSTYSLMKRFHDKRKAGEIKIHFIL